jgi:hypothetical protein
LGSDSSNEQIYNLHKVVGLYSCLVLLVISEDETSDEQQCEAEGIGGAACGVSRDGVGAGGHGWVRPSGQELVGYHGLLLGTQLMLLLCECLPLG